DAQIISWLGEIRTCVSQLGKDHEQLIYVVLKLPCLGHSQAVVEEYLAFLSNLLSAQTVYLRACLRMVISNFAPTYAMIHCFFFLIHKDLPRTFDQCHQALQLIATYVPSTSRFLMPILSDKFPFVQKSSRTLVSYVERFSTAFKSSTGVTSSHVSAPWSEIEEMERGAQQDADGTSQDDCLFDMGLAEVFLEHLWKMLQAHNQPPILRQAAAGYMDSFMARAKFLPSFNRTVKACLDLLAPWLHLYIDSQDSGSKAFCDVSLHSPFYTACQAVFYTLLFKNSAILEGNMKKVLFFCIVCPGPFCRVGVPSGIESRAYRDVPAQPAEGLSNMFAAITRKYQLVFCYTIIEQNNRNLLPVVSCSTLSTNTNPLDTFFPFDLYLLKSSGKLIEPIYQAWEEPSDCVIDVPKKEMRKVMYILSGHKDIGVFVCPFKQI
ncbi:hypothetical protein cypCar_00017428, partial [Cyprinus carpio]